MRHRLVVTLALLVAFSPAAVRAAETPRPARAAADSILYATRTADGNLVGVGLTNYGFLGNNFVSRSPSFEYPLGSSYEHLVRGGLWVGAKAVDGQGAFIGVSTGAIDDAAGSSSQSRTEYTPAGLTIDKRSNLPASPYYDPRALSNLDLDCWFSDEPARVLSPESHRPLNILVRQFVRSWTHADLAHALFLDYVVTNHGTSPLQDVYVGLYTELASGSRADYSCWPPAAFCGVSGGWYAKAWVLYDSALRLFREHYCYNLPIPSGCDLAHVPEWVGVKLLGLSPGSLFDPGKHVTLAAWKYGPSDTTRARDVQRYAIMSKGAIQDLSGPDFQPYTGDPCELLAVGPFATIAPGDSVVVSFALVGGAEVADIQQHAQTAQMVYDGSYDVSVPVQASLVSADAEPGLARIRWYVTDRSGVRWTVARSEAGGPWRAIGEAAIDGSGYALFEDHGVTAGRRYGYRLESPSGVDFGEAWVDVPAAATFALRGARPNPAGRDGLAVSFSLAEAGAASVEVFDLAGRRVLARELGSLGPGSHVVRLDEARTLAAGTYVIRLRQGGRSATLRAVVLE